MSNLQSKKRKPIKPSERPARMADDSYSVNEFAAAERMSRSMVYKLWSQGQGPAYYMVGSIRRISHQARIDWQNERVADGYASGEEGEAR